MTVTRNASCFLVAKLAEKDGGGRSVQGRRRLFSEGAKNSAV